MPGLWQTHATAAATHTPVPGSGPRTLPRDLRAPKNHQHHVPVGPRVMAVRSLLASRSSTGPPGAPSVDDHLCALLRLHGEPPGCSPQGFPWKCRGPSGSQRRSQPFIPANSAGARPRDIWGTRRFSPVGKSSSVALRVPCGTVYRSAATQRRGLSRARALAGGFRGLRALPPSRRHTAAAERRLRGSLWPIRSRPEPQPTLQHCRPAPLRSIRASSPAGAWPLHRALYYITLI